MADPDVKQRLISNTEQSVARGTFGSPTFLVGSEIYFGKDRLRDVEEEILRAAAAGEKVDAMRIWKAVANVNPAKVVPCVFQCVIDQVSKNPGYC